MSAEQVLPLPVGALPEKIRKFGDPSAPASARMMAAQGMVPIKGGDLVFLLAQLSADSHVELSEAAAATFDGLPDAVLLPACKEPLHPAVIDAISMRFSRKRAVLEALAQNHSTSDRTMTRIATDCTEQISEIIAVNQQRLIQHPALIEALYKNRNTRMSTADRLIELAARHGVELPGIPNFKDLVAAVKGQLIVEPTEERLPVDDLFADALAEDDDRDAIVRDEEEGTEEVVEEFIPLLSKIRNMTIGEKLRLALLGSSAARSILIRDPNKLVSMATISAPTVNENEAKNIAQSREVPEDVLRFISKKKEWIRSYEIKRSLVFNSKTPLGISMNLMSHLRRNDMRALAKSRGVPQPLRTAALRRSKQYN